ncbi:MFS transporter [Paraburkholderia sp. D15]|uniref:MFS transporter n=1 Tax=Paraburkholderia sp. D15 TaxID=2880218 RepID=UPI002478FC52|nr:MFS transporter [Paraburkholderia sp. D15]WGS53247.1 MFS transporter [Paraburkholderia sp. D15]
MTAVAEKPASNGFADAQTHNPANTAYKAPRIFPTVAAASIGFSIVQLDVTVVNVAIPALGHSFDSTVHGLQWVVDAYTLSFASLLLSSGSLADRLGSKRLFGYGLALFLLASLGCALAPNLATLIVARVVQGAAAALILPTSLSLITHACAGHAASRVKAVSWWSATGGLISAAGPTLGGLLIDHFGWRAIFLINLPVCVLTLWLTYRFVRESTRSASRRLDPAGQLVAIVTLGVLTASIIGSGAYGWSDPWVWGGLVSAALLGVAFVALERRHPAPMLPLAFFRIPGFPGAVVVGALSNLAFYGLIFSLSLYFQRSQGYTATQAGMALFPLTIIMLANIASAKLSVRFGFRTTIVVGLCASAIGYLSLGLLLGRSAYPALVPGLALMAIGGGIAIPALTAFLLGHVEAGQSGIASAILNTGRQVGAAIGVALLGALVSGNAQAIAAGASHAFLFATGLLVVCILLTLRQK